MLVLATLLVHETSLVNTIFIVHFWGGGVYKEYSLYACESAENYGWSLKLKIIK